MSSSASPAPAASAPPPLASMSHLTGRHLWIAIAGVLLGLFLSSLNQTIVGTAMPRIVAELGGLEQYAWVTTAYLLTSTAAVPIFGKLSDTYGRKWFYVGGVVMFMIASALCGASQTMLQLIIFRGLQGIAGGILMANTFAIIGDLFPPAERGKWQGVTGSVFGLASVIGPTLGGWLTDGPGWRWVFYITLPVGFIAIAVLVIGLPQIRSHETKPVDWLGAGTIVAAVVPLLLALSWAGVQYPWGSPQVIGLLAAAVIFSIIFVVIETRAADPMIPLDLFRNRTFTVSTLSMFFLGAGMFGAIMYIPLFVQAVIGVSATDSGLVLTPLMLSLVVSSTLSGQVVSRTGRYKWAVVSGLLLMLVGMFLLSRVNTSTTQGETIGYMIVLGVGMGMVMPTITLAVQNAFPAQRLGVVTASTQFFRQIGATMGIAIMGTLLTTTLTGNLERDIPADLAAQLPPGLVDELDPQALASPDATANLEARLAGLPNGTALFDQLLQVLRGSFADAIQSAFLLATVVALLAVAIGVFLPELPLRKRESKEPEEQTGKQMGATGVATGAMTPASDQPRLVREPQRGRAD